MHTIIGNELIFEHDTYKMIIPLQHGRIHTPPGTYFYNSEITNDVIEVLTKLFKRKMEIHKFLDLLEDVVRDGDDYYCGDYKFTVTNPCHSPTCYFVKVDRRLYKNLSGIKNLVAHIF